MGPVASTSTHGYPKSCAFPAKYIDLRTTTANEDYFPGHCGDSDPRYAEIEMMSSWESFKTTLFISATAVPALDPL